MDAGIADVDDRNVAEDWRGFGLEMASAISRSVLSRTRIKYYSLHQIHFYQIIVRFHRSPYTRHVYLD